MKSILIFSGNRSEFYLICRLLDSFYNYNIKFKLILSNEVSKLLKEYPNKSLKSYINKNSIKINLQRELDFKDLLKILNLVNKKIKLLNFDKAIIYGDRLESYAFSIILNTLNKKIIHIGGGDITLGSLDNKFRDFITLSANYHFVTNHKSKKRLSKLGISKENIYNVGYLLPKIHKQIISKKLKKIFDSLDNKYFLITIHPNTLADRITNLNEVKILLKSLEYFVEKYGMIFTYPNADKYNQIIINEITKFVNKFKNFKNIYFFKSLGVDYQYILNRSLVCIGNSSSGLYEAPFYGTPTLNIGSRQKGRILHKTVFNCEFDINNIKHNLNKILRSRMKIKRFEYHTIRTEFEIIKIIKQINER